MYHNFLKFISLVFLLAVSLAGCMGPRNELPTYSREVARVDDLIVEEELLRFKVRLEINKLPEGVFDMTNTEDLKKNREFQELLQDVFQKMLDDLTIIAYANKKGVAVSQDEINQGLNKRKKSLNPKTFDNLLLEKNIPYSRWKQLVENEVRVQAILDKELGEKIKISMNEVTSYYNKNRDAFITPERVRVRQIVTDTLEKASAVHERVLNGENFSKIAVNHSLSPDRAQGGDLGYFARGNFPAEFDETCFSLKKGEISPVVKSDYGYHIFKLIDRQPPGRKALLEASSEIYQKLFEEKLKKKYDEWLAEAKKNVSISINQDVLDTFFL